MNHGFVRRILLLVILLAGLGVPLFAGIGGGFKFEFGVNGILVPLTAFADAGDDFWDPGTSSDGMVLPIGSLGWFGQVNFGPLHLGAGIQNYNMVIAGIFWPVVYAEADLWKFTINAAVGGGAFLAHTYFYTHFFTGDYLVPDVSIWFRHKHFKIGVGAVTIMATHEIPEYFSNFSANKLLFYMGFRWYVFVGKE
ncbi:hypothetical protein FACS189483_05610 [Spirochaetia bacterium]|nr:hypothetical protein FACS189483_05610 [Spirochaetia bacterium]